MFQGYELVHPFDPFKTRGSQISIPSSEGESKKLIKVQATVETLDDAKRIAGADIHLNCRDEDVRRLAGYSTAVLPSCAMVVMILSE